MGRRAIDPVDTIWLNMDRANNLMVIESLMTLESPMDLAAAKTTSGAASTTRCSVSKTS